MGGAALALLGAMLATWTRVREEERLRREREEQKAENQRRRLAQLEAQQQAARLAAQDNLNDYMAEKMDRIDAADEAEWDRVQPALAARELERQQAYDRHRQREWADGATPLAEMACVAGNNDFIQPFLPWLPSLGLEKDVEIPLITMPILPYFVTAGYTLGVEAQTLANLPTHLSNKAISLGVGSLKASLASDANSLGVGASVPLPFQNPSSPAQTISGSASINWDGLWGTTIRYTADVVTAPPTSASSSYSQGIYVEINPVRVAAVGIAIAVALILAPEVAAFIFGSGGIATVPQLQIP